MFQNYALLLVGVTALILIAVALGGQHRNAASSTLSFRIIAVAAGEIASGKLGDVSFAAPASMAIGGHTAGLLTISPRLFLGWRRRGRARRSDWGRSL
jgi:hypothetical protein